MRSPNGLKNRKIRYHVMAQRFSGLKHLKVCQQVQDGGRDFLELSLYCCTVLAILGLVRGAQLHGFWWVRTVTDQVFL